MMFEATRKHKDIEHDIDDITDRNDNAFGEYKQP